MPKVNVNVKVNTREKFQVFSGDILVLKEKGVNDYTTRQIISSKEEYTAITPEGYRGTTGKTIREILDFYEESSDHELIGVASKVRIEIDEINFF